MKKKEILLAAILLIIIINTWGQQMDLYPATIIPSSYTITASAGLLPANPTTNNTSQSVRYKWPFNNWLFTNLTVESSTTIPSGISITVKATGDDGGDGFLLQNRYGTGDVTVTVTSTPQNLITSIWSTNASTYYGTVKQVYRPLIQNIIISDFSKLRPGTYPISIIYVMQ